MEKRARISSTSKKSSIEEMRESAATIDGIMSGVYGALACRTDISDEILQLLAIGAARAQILTEDLAAIHAGRLSVVRSN
jgi:hypothetical protein